MKNLPTMPLAMLPASPDVEKAFPAMLEAWLNLSHREKANELVMVRAIAIAVGKAEVLVVSTRRKAGTATNHSLPSLSPSHHTHHITNIPQFPRLSSCRTSCGYWGRGRGMKANHTHQLAATR